MEKTVVAVGDSARLEIIFMTKTYKRKMTKRPRIKTNEGPPDKHVSITATVTPRPDSTYPIIIKPYKIDLSQFSEKVIDEAEFKISNVSDQELTVNLISSRPDLWELTLPEKIDPGDVGTGVIKIHQDVLEDSFEKSFTLELNDEQTSRFTVPVKRTVRSAAQAAKVRDRASGK